MHTRALSWLRSNEERIAPSVYALALLGAVSVWLLAVRAPLWLDETGSYWNIAGGFHQIWSRSIELNSFPAYFYVLWATNAIFGTHEVVLRIPSLLAMLAATYVFYCSARELFAWDVARMATVLFILNRRIVFAAIDVRPYAFALLVTNLAILCLLRWRKTSSKTGKTRYAALLGIASAGIFFFHYLFGCIVAAFVVIYLVDAGRRHSLFAELRPFVVAAGCFALLMLPVLPRLWYLHQTSNTHVFADPPSFKLFLRALSPGPAAFVLVGAILLAALMRKLAKPNPQNLSQLMVSAALALVPLAILYGVSVATPMHIFIPRYETVAVPGVSFGWAWIFSLIDSPRLRLAACSAFVACAVCLTCLSPTAFTHGDTWKYALEFADANAARDGSPLIICSDLPEADFQPMPAGPLGESVLFSPLGYYRVRATVVPMPRTLNEQAQAIGARFAERAGLDHRRFLALGYRASYPTLEWLRSQTSSTHAARVLGEFESVRVVEFSPLEPARGK